MQDFKQELCEICGIENIFFNENLKKHSSIKIGGSSEVLVKPLNKEQIEKTICACLKNKINFCVVGEGTNVLFSDKGFKGVVMKLSDNFSGIEREGNVLKILSGTRLNYVNKFCVEFGLSGLENLFMIPGNIGGAVFMNAGAFGKEISDCVKSVEFLMDGEIKSYTREECRFGYRDSIFQHMDNVVILSAELELNTEEKSAVKEKCMQFLKQKIESQPYDQPSLGSVFKRANNLIPAKVIDDLGLKGKMIGGAQISEKHSGFIVNAGNAKSEDFFNLIDFIQEKVYNKYKTYLSLEIKVIGEP